MTYLHIIYIYIYLVITLSREKYSKKLSENVFFPFQTFAKVCLIDWLMLQLPHLFAKYLSEFNRHPVYNSSTMNYAESIGVFT